jgi:hypothetical protein
MEYPAVTAGEALATGASVTVVGIAGVDTLEVAAAKRRTLGLLAPVNGGMTRTIHESASCPVRYHCTIGGETLFDLTCDQASFEANW